MDDLTAIAEGISKPNGGREAAIMLVRKCKFDLIQEVAVAEGFKLSHVDTVAILCDSEVKTKKSEMLTVLNLEKAWDFLLSNLDYNDCWMLLSQLHKIVVCDIWPTCGDLRVIPERIIGTDYVAPVPYIDNVHEQIWKLRDIEDAEERALEFYLWLVRARLFSGKNLSVAQLMANKVLVGAGVGILSCPVLLMHEYQSLLLQYYNTGDGSDLKEFLRDKCITRA